MVVLRSILLSEEFQAIATAKSQGCSYLNNLNIVRNTQLIHINQNNFHNARSTFCTQGDAVVNIFFTSQIRNWLFLHNR